MLSHLADLRLRNEDLVMHFRVGECLGGCGEGDIPSLIKCSSTDATSSVIVSPAKTGRRVQCE